MFTITGGRVRQVKAEELPERPADASPANGDPFTPYYKKEDHHDDEHIHVYGKTFGEALFKVNTILR